MKTHHSFPRRDFIKTATVATGMLAMAPSRAVGANDRLRIGVIGCGGMGTGHLNDLVKRSEAENIEVVAVSDLFQKRLTRAKGICKGEGYMDYRKLLERKDVDAVLIATPDHWHSKISVEALESGKHVY
jgi:predicted dehydrogenase